MHLLNIRSSSTRCSLLNFFSASFSSSAPVPLLCKSSFFENSSPLSLDTLIQDLREGRNSVQSRLPNSQHLKIKKKNETPNCDKLPVFPWSLTAKAFLPPVKVSELAKTTFLTFNKKLQRRGFYLARQTSTRNSFFSDVQIVSRGPRSEGWVSKFVSKGVFKG